MRGSSDNGALHIFNLKILNTYYYFVLYLHGED